MAASTWRNSHFWRSSQSWRGINPAAPQTVTCTGFDSSAYGSISLATTISVTGFSAGALGTPYIDYHYNIVAPGGIAPPPDTGPNSNRQVPQPLQVDYRIRHLYPSGVSSGNVGSSIVTHYTQFVDTHSAATGEVFGTTTLTFAIRYIEPPYIISAVYGLPNVAFILSIAPSGWQDSSVSTGAELDINLQRLYPTSGAADPAQYGDTHIRTAFQDVRPLGWLNDEINFPVIYNQDKYVFVSPYQDTNSDPTGWATYGPYVENKNRVIGPFGWVTSKFSVIGNVIKNTADPLFPPGLDATLWGPDTFIAYKIRTLSLSGWDNFYSSSYHAVYNALRVISPTGFANPSTVSTGASLVALNRTVKQVFPYGGESVGTSFIAYAIRNIKPSVFIEPPSGIPEVRFNPYPIAPAGIAPPQFGAPEVIIHFTVVAPRSVNVHTNPTIGEPTVLNRNRKVLVYPSDQSLYGTPVIYNYIQNLTIGAGDLSSHGATLIEYRTKTLRPVPISVPVFTPLHRIRNDIPDPPAQQTVIVYTFNEAQVPSPDLHYATIFPSGFFSETVPQPKLTRNTIAPQPGIFELLQVGEPYIQGPQSLFPRMIPDSSDRGDSAVGTPRMTPHNIYAPAGDMATDQYRQNNPAQGFPSVIDAGSGFPTFGTHAVSNQFRGLQFQGADFTALFGAAKIALLRQYVYPQPVRSQRFGLVVLWGVPQYVNLNDVSYGFDSLAMGDTSIAYAPVDVDGLVAPGGIDSIRFGTTDIMLFNREITPQGIPHRGNPQQGLTNPWGLPLVGYPRIYNWGGYVLTLWGNATIEYKNRSMTAIGWLSSTLEDEYLGSFNDRMRVTRRNPTDSIAGIGPDSHVGTPTVTFTVRTIIGRGPEITVIGRHKIKGTNTIIPDSWDDTVFGDIDRWEAGKIKAHGDEMFSPGYPRLKVRLQPKEFDTDASVPYPRVGRVVRTSGLPPVGFDGPVVSNPFGCTNRAIIPLPILSGEVVPPPTSVKN